MPGNYRRSKRDPEGVAPEVIVVDASVLLAAEDVNDGHHRASVSTLQREQLATVDLAWYDVSNVADGVWADPATGDRLRARLGLIAAHGRMVIADTELAEHIAGLIREHGLSSYDAAYVAAARRLGAELVSCHERDLVSRGLARLPTV